MVCTFFGHGTVSEAIEPVLRATLTDLIENNGARSFYVGDSGAFDATVYRVLKELSGRYRIRYTVVLAKMPTADTEKRDANTVLPDGIERVPGRFTIDYRNRWMLKQADAVITYVITSIGSGAAKFQKLAEKQGKTVIRLGEMSAVSL